MAHASEDVLLRYLLEEEEEEEECCLVMQAELERSSPNELFTSRKEQGCQRILIERHLLKDEYIFRKFFRVNIAQFNYILSLIETEISGKPSHFIKHPITPAEIQQSEYSI